MGGWAIGAGVLYKKGKEGTWRMLWLFLGGGLSEVGRGSAVSYHMIFMLIQGGRGVGEEPNAERRVWVIDSIHR